MHRKNLLLPSKLLIGHISLSHFDKSIVGYTTGNYAKTVLPAFMHIVAGNIKLQLTEKVERFWDTV